MNVAILALVDELGHPGNEVEEEHWEAEKEQEVIEEGNGMGVDLKAGDNVIGIGRCDYEDCKDDNPQQITDKLVLVIVTFAHGEKNNADASDDDERQDAGEHAAVGGGAVGKEHAGLLVTFNAVQVLHRTLWPDILCFHEENHLWRDGRKKLEALLMILNVSNACPEDEPGNR